MLSDYYYVNYERIINDPRQDGFTAVLLKYLSRISTEEVEWWQTQYPEECELTLAKFDSSREYISLPYLFLKANKDNRRKMAAVMRLIAHCIYPVEE